MIPLESEPFKSFFERKKQMLKDFSFIWGITTCLTDD